MEAAMIELSATVLPYLVKFTEAILLPFLAAMTVIQFLVIVVKMRLNKSMKAVERIVGYSTASNMRELKDEQLKDMYEKSARAIADKLFAEKSVAEIYLGCLFKMSQTELEQRAAGTNQSLIANGKE